MNFPLNEPQRAELIANLSSANLQQVAHAAHNNNVEAVRWMVDAGLPVDKPGRHGATPLHWAAQYGHLAVADYLIGRGAAVGPAVGGGASGAADGRWGPPDVVTTAHAPAATATTTAMASVRTRRIRRRFRRRPCRP